MGTTEESPRRSDRSVVELEFSITDSSFPFVGATEDGDCVMELAEMFPRDDGEYAEFFHVSGASPDRVLALAESYDALEASLLREYRRGALFEFIIRGRCPAFSLAERGALPREAISADGEARIVAELPAESDPSAVVEPFLRENPDSRLASKCERDGFSPFFDRSALEELLHSHLTDRQREVLSAAYEAGYYEWPREASGTDVAEDLGITSATFSEHIHAAERKLLAALFDRPGGDSESSGPG